MPFQPLGTAVHARSRRAKHDVREIPWDRAEINAEADA
jgi:hypothetical protein